MLAESGQGLPVGNTLELGQRCKDVFHSSSAKPRKGDDAKGDEVGIVETNGILARVGVVVAQVEKLGSMRSSFRNEGVGEENERDEVEGKAWI